MNKEKKILSCLLSCLFCFSGCVFPWHRGPHPSVEGLAERWAKDEEKIVVFVNGASGDFWARNDKGNGHPFHCAFSKYNAVIENGLLTLSLTKAETGYVGAEYRSHQRYGYGFYAVRMKAIACSGVISSFFTYTYWPWWDEIDIEFLGKDTTKIQFNYYVKGVGGHEYVYELGFDGAENFHEYAFDWQKDCITWYVDGVPVYRATENIPSASGQVMMNVWSVADSNANWAGKFDESALPVSAQYEWIAFSKNE